MVIIKGNPIYEREGAEPAEYPDLGRLGPLVPGAEKAPPVKDPQKVVIEYNKLVEDHDILTFAQCRLRRTRPNADGGCRSQHVYGPAARRL